MVALYEECEISSGGGGSRYGSISESPSADCIENGERKPLVGDGADERCTTPTDNELLHDELAGMTRLAVPVIFTYLLEMFPRIVTIILVGRIESLEERAGDDHSLSLQKLHLDAASLAIMFGNVVSLSPAFGLLTALDTLCSQAHGAAQPQKMGTYAFTSLAIMSAIFLASCVVIWNTSPILIALGQPPEVSELAGVFARYMLPGLPFVYAYEILRKVFQARNEAVPMLIAAVVCNITNITLGYYLVRCTDWGWIGAAIASSVGNIVLVPSVLMAMVMGLGGGTKAEDVADIPNGSRDEWDTQQYLEVDPVTASDDEDDREFLHHMWEGFVVGEALNARAFIEFISLGFPGMLQLMFEWCAFEAIALLCGILPGQEAIVGIGANTVIMQVSSMTYMLYLGVSVSGNVRIGNALGAGDVHRAEIASNLTLGAGVVMAMVNVALLLLLRNGLPWLFTTDLDIVEKAQHLFLIVAAFQLPDAINSSVQGIFRGSGRQMVGAQWNFVGYYIIGIPLGYVLEMKLHQGVDGLWWGMTVGLCVISIGCTIIILRSNWKKHALEAASRLNR
ncbi:hypothetical protein ACHAXT_002807 [Thalassiosira profunda]